MVHDVLQIHKIDIPLKEIENIYSEPYRYYHNISHINYILGRILSMNISQQNRDILIITDIFHDIVYIPGSEFNEIRSAHFLLKYSSVITGIITKSYDIIIDTKDHKPRTKLSKIFCHMDMHPITDGNIEELITYVNNITKEYSTKYDKDTVIKGQIHFLKTVINTEYGMSNKYNIEKVINYLENKIY